MANTILIVGDTLRTLPEYLRNHGYEYIVLKDIRKAKHTTEDKHHVVCDFGSRDAIFATVDEITQKHPIDGVIVTYENYITPAAEIAAYLGLPGMPVDAAKACTDKYLMRQRFAAAPQKISPDYAVVKNMKDLADFAATHAFPLILKPANLSKSLLVFKNYNLDELINNYQRAMATIGAIYEKYAPTQTPKLLVEEFMEGPVHSVDAFVDKNGVPHVLEQVVDYETGYDIGYDDNFHYSRIIPSKLSDKEKDAIRTTAAIGCQALGMKSSPAHIEIIRTVDGPRIVEIGARNGGYRERMHRLANGIDLTDNAVQLALGQAPNIEATKDDFCAALELFPRTPGIFTGIRHENELHELPSLNYVAIKQTIGTHVGKSSDGYKMCAVIILHNKDKEQFQKDLTFINKHVAITTK